MGTPPENPATVPAVRRRPGWQHPAIAIVLGIVCLGLAFRGVDRTGLLTLLRRTTPGFLVLAAAAAFLSIMVRCLKVGVLLRPVQRVRYRILLAAELVGVMIDTMLPVRTSYLVRAYVISRRAPVSAAFVLGAEVVEKIMEALLLATGLIALSSAARFPAWAESPLRLALAAAVLALGGLMVVVRWPALAQRPAQMLGRWNAPGLRTFGGWLSRMAEGMAQTAARPASWLLVLLLTAAEWTWLAVSFWAAAQAVGVSLPPLAVVGVLAANHLAFAIPASTSGAVGVYEVTVSMTLVLLFGLPKEEALSLVLLAHAILIFVALAGGVAGLRLAGLSLREIRERARRPAETAAAPV